MHEGQLANAVMILFCILVNRKIRSAHHLVRQLAREQRERRI